MSVTKLPESLAFSEGSQLWLIKNDPNNFWWKKIDIRSRYLLSENFLMKKKQMADELKNILIETNLHFSKKDFTCEYALLGTENHFLNKWILIWNDLTESQTRQLIEETVQNLKVESLRFFSNVKMANDLATRPLTSSLSISYVEKM